MSPTIRGSCDETPSDSMSDLRHEHSSLVGCTSTVAETSDCDSGVDDTSSWDESRRGLGLHAKSWPLNSLRHLEQVRSALRSCSPGKKSLRFADSYGLPLVSVLHYRQFESVEEFRDGMLEGKLGGAGGKSWSSTRSAMEDAWSWEDNLELSLSSARSSCNPCGRANSWDLPSTMKLRRAGKAGRMSKLSHGKADKSDAEAAAHTDTSPLTASTANLRLEGGALPASALRDRLARQQVCLEYVSLQDFSVFGSIVVSNISFEKEVSLRYTIDNWATSCNLTASYVTGSTSQDGSSDRFSFTYVLPSPSTSASGKVPPRLEFAVCFKTPLGEYWDSNDGKNFAIVPV
ncbi:protein phosphatase 1 regulatory subunit 3C-like [Sycon ciliatum]|uniref:protein phosphatase 1 regulatory subunit 3C-like n=1 Tax=Sycon ciliatum TaxID=27933 RepID=UPI0031F620ED